MPFQILKFSQNSHNFISAVLPFEIINKHSQVLIYGKDSGGYQREPDEIHYNKIKAYVNDDKEYLFPTSIILGVDEKLISKLINKRDDVYELDFTTVEDNKVFRIVDGQHRLKGLFEASQNNHKINELLLSVLIIITPENTRSIEMQIFNTINSKSKRIKVDLIQLASFEYRVLEQKIKPKDLNEHISVQVANLLNEDSNNKWFNAIKFGIHSEEKIGIIGVNAFRESLKSIVSKYLALNKQHEQLDGRQLIDFTKEASQNIKKNVLEAWKIIQEKWPDCFSAKSQELDYDFEIREFYYKSDFYIQKTLGAKSLNYLFGSIVNKEGYNLDNKSLDEFREIILNSDVITSDWEVGNTFSGYSSESAFNKISKMITGEIQIMRN